MEKVKPLIEESLGDLDVDVDVEMYEPNRPEGARDSIPAQPQLPYL